MSGNKILLDTNTVLYILNGDETLAEFLFDEELYLSIISEMELLSYRYITDEEKEKIKDFLKDLTIVNINDKIKLNAIDIKRSSNMKLPDGIIAATAMSLGISLITSDKHFQKIDKINLIYYEK